MKSKHLGEVVIDRDRIKQGVSYVAEQINQDYESAVVVTVVPGGILFAADLVRELEFAISMDYISCPHSPGDRNNTSQIVYHHNIDITGKDVIVVDDAIESGGTMRRLVEHLSEYNAKTISTATLFVKPGRVDVSAKQYFAYEMENNDLLVGYGLPWNEKLRNTPYICKLVK